jgi:cysteinyl-tRNA synthetase
MTLRLYNTLTRTKEDFIPIDPNNVRMYVCGPTVYDFAHIGNARPVIVFDVLFRLLRHLYGESHVTYVRNITDVDDKINARALRDFPNLPLNEAIRAVTQKTADQFQSDAKALGCLTPTEEPRATDNIQGMIDIISTLINKGHAYTAAGEVLFSVSSMADYGKLSGRKLEDQQAGARVAVEAHKKNPADFVLWKLSSAGEPSWDSPWGRGRPGWHIECSAMSKRYLGEAFDIHGGGLDLIFPHHENEIAQSCCAFEVKRMANVWMHNGFLQVEGKKMSKSDGNFFTIQQLLDQYPGDVLRSVMLQTHYRTPIDWTQSKCEESKSELFAWSLAIDELWEDAETNNFVVLELLEAIRDDLNTPDLFAVLRSLYAAAKNGTKENRLRLGWACKFLGFQKLGSYKLFSNQVSGVDAGPEIIFEVAEKAARLRSSIANTTVSHTLSNNAAYLEDISSRGFELKMKEDGTLEVIGQNKSFTKKIISLIENRLVARHTKNWKESDRIRDELDAMGVAIKDNKDGTTTWEVKR